jgi:hypothetical protein
LEVRGVIMGNTVYQAVAKASTKSKREGKWANKPEISAKITGKHPVSLISELNKLVKDNSIEKKRGKELWRPNAGGGVAGILGASVATGIRGGVESGVRGTVSRLLM